MFNGILAWGKSKRYTDDSLVGVGALKGKPCTVKSYRFDVSTDNTIITFAWIDDNGAEHTQEVMVKKGVDGADGAPGINGTNGADGADGAPGINGVDGEDGVTPTLVIDPVTFHWIINDVDTGVIAKGTKGDKGDQGDNYTKVSELENDLGFITKNVNNLVLYYTKSQVDTLISDLEGLNFQIVTTLPESPSTSTIYLIETAAGSGIYTQYMYINGSWSSIGSTDVNLSNYYTKSQTYSKAEVADILDDYALSNNVYTKAQVTAALSDKADQLTTYTKTEVNTLLNDKADVLTTYNKTQTDSLLGDKADKSDTYTRAQVTTLLGDKADVATTYTKNEVDGMLDDKEDKLPTVVNDRYLHTNSTTGALEWSEISVLDLIYPVGAIALGVHPQIGTWEKVTDAAGKALWGSDSAHLAGATIDAGIPNLKGSLYGLNWNSGQARVSIPYSTTGTFMYTGPTGSSTDPYVNGTGAAAGERLLYDASRVSSVYKDSVNTVQPPAYVVDVWIRTA